MAPLQTCCCCGSLKTGSIISGVLGIIGAIISLIILFVTNVEFKTIIFDWLPEWAVKTILAINLAMTILISILLIVGVIKKNTFLMLPWVILGIILAIGMLVSVIYTSVVFYNNDDVLNGTVFLVIGILGFCLNVYLWLVVYSYFDYIRDINGRYMRAPYRR